MSKILYITSGLGIGGAETMLVQLTRALQARGHVQHVISLSDKLDLAAALVDGRVEVSEVRLQPVWRASPALRALRRQMAAFAPDVIQGWMYHGNLAASLAHVMAPHRASRRLYWGLRASNMDSDRYGRMIRLGGLLSRQPNAVIANSQAGADFHVAQGFSAATMRVIANGIDTDRFRPDERLRAQVRGELGIAADAVVAINVARVDPMKDHDTFMAAAKSLPDVQVLLAGSGTEQLDRPANVRALGARNDVWRLYAAADIVVSSSAFGEGFSNVVAEGMSAGLVPVATDVGDAAIIVGDSGVIVPPRNAPALCEALSQIAALPADERLRRGLAARSRIEQRFSLTGAVDAFETLYRCA